MEFAYNAIFFHFTFFYSVNKQTCLDHQITGLS